MFASAPISTRTVLRWGLAALLGMVFMLLLALPGVSIQAQGPTPTPTEAPWPPDDNRLNPHRAEYYTVYCENDALWLYLASGSVVGQIDLRTILALNASGDIQYVDGYTITRGGDTITVGGYNGNYAGYGSKAFSLSQCLTNNGPVLSHYLPEPEPITVEVAPQAPAAAPAAPPSVTVQTDSTTVTINTGGSRTYVVQPGDNLFRISLRFGSSITEIAVANGIHDVTRIYVGDVLIIP